MERLRAYMAANNPELLVTLQDTRSLTAYLSGKVASVMPLARQLLAEGKPRHHIEERCMDELTAGLGSPEFGYLRTVLAEEFPDDYRRMARAGTLIPGLIRLTGDCREIFESHGFTGESMDDRLLRHAVIAEIHNYLN